MTFYTWFRKPKISKETIEQIKVPENLWIKCLGCEQLIFHQEFKENLKVCPKCSYHFRISATERIRYLLDTGTFIEEDKHLTSTDPLNFRDIKSYVKRLKESQEKTNLKEAVISGRGKIGGHKVIIAVLDFEFMGGSMGSVVGEKIKRAIERANRESTSLIIISASGGARMQEGMISLMQMAKVSFALSKLKTLYISVLTNPTTGGVAASFASLGDIIIAEKGALIGFAGLRVIEQTTKQKLPADFQKAERLLNCGMIDVLTERKNLRNILMKILELYNSRGIK